MLFLINLMHSCLIKVLFKKMTKPKLYEYMFNLAKVQVCQDYYH